LERLGRYVRLPPFSQFGSRRSRRLVGGQRVGGRPDARGSPLLPGAGASVGTEPLCAEPIPLTRARLLSRCVSLRPNRRIAGRAARDSLLSSPCVRSQQKR
jgi:hypothetical protein